MSLGDTSSSSTRFHEKALCTLKEIFKCRIYFAKNCHEKSSKGRILTAKCHYKTLQFTPLATREQ